MDPFGPKALLTALTAASLLAVRAVRSKGLTKAGAVAGFAVGFCMVATGMRGMILFYFYQVGSTATKYKKAFKATMDATVEVAATRGAGQVLCVSLAAAILSLWHAIQCGKERPLDFKQYPLESRITCAILSHHATCLADTLASELGILAKSPPVMIIRPWQQVPAGTNGGITLNGCMWSLFGGVLIGIFYIVTDAACGTYPLNTTPVLLFGGICGVLGSALDSVAGALLQATYYDPDTKRVYHADANLPKTAKHISGLSLLSNEQVNLVSVLATTFIGGWILGPWLFSLGL